MAITPLDIENKEFNRSLRGYNIDEVETYLDKILKEYEKIYIENQNLKSKIEYLEQQLDNYKDLESDLKETLLMAQKTSDDVKKNAEKEAELIYEKAVNKAKSIVNAAEEEARRKEDEINRLNEIFIKFKSQVKSLINVQLELLDNNSLVDNTKFEAEVAVGKEEEYKEEKVEEEGSFD